MEFCLDDKEFDEGTYWGRLRQFSKSCNPIYFHYSQRQIKEMQAEVAKQRELEDQQFKENGRRHVMLSKERIQYLRKC